MTFTPPLSNPSAITVTEKWLDVEDLWNSVNWNLELDKIFAKITLMACPSCREEKAQDSPLTDSCWCCDDSLVKLNLDPAITQRIHEIQKEMYRIDESLGKIIDRKISHRMTELNVVWSDLDFPSAS